MQKQFVVPRMMVLIFLGVVFLFPAYADAFSATGDAAVNAEELLRPYVGPGLPFTHKSHFRMLPDRSDQGAADFRLDLGSGGSGSFSYGVGGEYQHASGFSIAVEYVRYFSDVSALGGDIAYHF